MKYTVTGKSAEIGIAQQLKLSAAQIDARRHVLEVHDEGVVITTGVVTFKKGEEINLKEKFEDLPRLLQDVLTPSSKVTADEKQKSTQRKKKDDAQSGAQQQSGDDLDDIEARLEAAEAAYRAALIQHGFTEGDELNAEQKALVEKELVELESANKAYAEAIGE